MGVLHGMLMPAALPGLLMGNDLPIYAPNNTGRTYNIGYAFGVNCCGTLFFGISFWQPRRWRRAKNLRFTIYDFEKCRDRTRNDNRNLNQYGQSQKISMTLNTPPPQ